MSLTAKPRAILFDWDNTLVNSWPVIHAALHHTFVSMGHEPWTLEQTRARVGKSMRDSFPDLFGEEWQQAADIYQQDYRARHLNSLETLPDAQQVLDYLARQDGLYLAVVSNKRGDTLRKEAEHLGWNQHFHKLVGAGDAGRDKPYPDPVYLALAEGEIAAGEDVWFIGDSAVDLQCADAAGCCAVLFGDHRTNGDGKTHGGQPYHHHVASHKQLLEWLKLVF